MLGITFKENCPDIRNKRTIDIYHEIKSYGMEVDVFDPWANSYEVNHEYEIDLLSENPNNNHFGTIILAVAHKEFIEIDLKEHKDNGIVVFDVKGILDKQIINARLQLFKL